MPKFSKADIKKFFFKKDWFKENTPGFKNATIQKNTGLLIKEITKLQKDFEYDFSCVSGPVGNNLDAHVLNISKFETVRDCMEDEFKKAQKDNKDFFKFSREFLDDLLKAAKAEINKFDANVGNEEDGGGGKSDEEFARELAEQGIELAEEQKGAHHPGLDDIEDDAVGVDDGKKDPEIKSKLFANNGKWFAKRCPDFTDGAPGKNKGTRGIFLGRFQELYQNVGKYCDNTGMPDGRRYDQETAREVYRQFYRYLTTITGKNRMKVSKTFTRNNKAYDGEQWLVDLNNIMKRATAMAKRDMEGGNPNMNSAEGAEALRQSLAQSSADMLNDFARLQKESMAQIKGLEQQFAGMIAALKQKYGAIDQGNLDEKQLEGFQKALSETPAITNARKAIETSWSAGAINAVNLLDYDAARLGLDDARKQTKAYKTQLDKVRDKLIDKTVKQLQSMINSWKEKVGLVFDENDDETAGGPELERSDSTSSEDSEAFYDGYLEERDPDATDKMNLENGESLKLQLKSNNQTNSFNMKSDLQTKKAEYDAAVEKIKASVGVADAKQVAQSIDQLIETINAGANGVIEHNNKTVDLFAKSMAGLLPQGGSHYEIYAADHGVPTQETIDNWVSDNKDNNKKLGETLAASFANKLGKLRSIAIGRDGAIEELAKMKDGVIKVNQAKKAAEPELKRMLRGYKMTAEDAQKVCISIMGRAQTGNEDFVKLREEMENLMANSGISSAEADARTEFDETIDEVVQLKKQVDFDAVNKPAHDLRGKAWTALDEWIKDGRDKWLDITTQAINSIHAFMIERHKWLVDRTPKTEQNENVDSEVA